MSLIGFGGDSSGESGGPLAGCYSSPRAQSHSRPWKDHGRFGS